jgi:hypothetical protein
MHPGRLASDVRFYPLPVADAALPSPSERARCLPSETGKRMFSLLIHASS